MSTDPGDFLLRMARLSRERAVAAMQERPEAALAARARRLPAPPPLRLSPAGFDLIAEVKRRSPALGTLAGSALQVAAQARAYARGGAAALSVLTEPAEFSGELAHLVEAAAAAAPVPVMRKDFLVLPYQLYEARAAGASGVLLIAAMLDDAALREMLDVALELGLFVLVEVFDRADLERAQAALATAGPAEGQDRCRWLIGVNCRDLRTLAVDFGRFAELAPALPRDVPLVAESGVQTEDEAAQVAALGYRLALVGTALMRATDPAATLAALLGAGRDRSRACASS